jgi:hypothetical protein
LKPFLIGISRFDMKMDCNKENYRAITGRLGQRIHKQYKAGKFKLFVADLIWEETVENEGFVLLPMYTPSPSNYQ